MRGLSATHAGMGRECGRNTNGVWGPPGRGSALRQVSKFALQQPACNRKPTPLGVWKRAGAHTALGHLLAHRFSRGCPKQFWLLPMPLVHG